MLVRKCGAIDGDHLLVYEWIKRSSQREELITRLRKELQAEDAGLILRGLRSDARKSAESPVDFGQLFMGFSFFVIAGSCHYRHAVHFPWNKEANKLDY